MNNRRIFAIAKIVFKESLRSKVIISLIVLAFLLIILSIFLDPITLGETVRIVKDVGLTSTSFFSLLIILLAGTRLIFQETDKKTIYLIIPKPIKRKEFLLGKFLGLLSIIWLIGIATGLFLIIILLLFKISFGMILIIAILFILLQFTLLSSIVIFFSTFVSPVLVGFFTIMTYIIGFLIKDLSFFLQKTDSIIVKYIIKSIMLIVPNFYYIDAKLWAVQNISISINYIIFVITYTIIYTILFLYISFLIFDKKEF